MSIENEDKCLILWAMLIFLFVTIATGIKIAEDPRNQ